MTKSLSWARPTSGMGMFDDLTVSCPWVASQLNIPAKYVGRRRTFQTKDLDCSLSEYVIMPGGLLFRVQPVYTERSEERLRDRLVKSFLVPTDLVEEFQDSWYKFALSKERRAGSRHGSFEYLALDSEFRKQPDYYGLFPAPESVSIQFYDTHEDYGVEFRNGVAHIDGMVCPTPPSVLWRFPRKWISPWYMNLHYWAVCVGSVYTAYDAASSANEFIRAEAMEVLRLAYPGKMKRCYHPTVSSAQQVMDARDFVSEWLAHRNLERST